MFEVPVWRLGVLKSVRGAVIVHGRAEKMIAGVITVIAVVEGGEVFVIELLHQIIAIWAREKLQLLCHVLILAVFRGHGWSHSLRSRSWNRGRQSSKNARLAELLNFTLSQTLVGHALWTFPWLLI